MFLGATPVAAAPNGAGGGESPMSALCVIVIDGDGDMTPGGPAPSGFAAVNVEDVVLSVGWSGIEIDAANSEITFTVGN
jgi:hypothetical protein